MDVRTDFNLPYALSDLTIKLFGLWILVELCHGLFIIYKCWRVGRKLQHLPHLPPSLLGPLDEVSKRNDRHRLYTEWAQKYGPVMTYRVLNTHVVMVTDPVIAAEALRHKSLDKNLPAGFGNRAIDDFTGPHAHQTILTLPTDDRWKAVRKAVATAFSNTNMRANFPGIRTACSQLIEVLTEMGPNKPVDMDNATCRESLDVIGMVGFGRDLGATRSLMDHDEPGQAITATQAAQHEAELGLNDPLRRYKIWRRDVWAGNAATKRFHKVIARLLADIRQKRPAESTFAAHLLDIVDPRTGATLTDEFLQPEIALLFLAGFETTGHTASWTIYAISQNPDVEAKVVDELASLGLLATPAQPQPRPIEWDDISKLTYLNAVIKEAMRKYPAGGVASFRTPVKGAGDVVLGGGKVVIPEGAVIHTPIAAIQLSPALWDEPERFNPDRWLQDDAEYVPGGVKLADGKAPKRFIPFGEGARNCVGQTLARLNLTTAMAQLYGSFTFRLASEMGTPEEVKAAEAVNITLSCSKGMKMHVIPRVAPVKASAAA
ncbi:Cytochrome P450 3A11 [Coccomyxa sp. Obi]|nr:Cytochrome P450 3A11 [Coccomyxa sp. Obi]